MIDAVCFRLLAKVQINAMITAQDFGEKLNLSASQSAQRRQRLEAEGFIVGQTARLEPEKPELTVQAFVQVQMAGHAPDIAKSLGQLSATLPRSHLGMDIDWRGGLPFADKVRRSFRA